MKVMCLVFVLLLSGMFMLVGCADTGAGPAGPTNAPVLSGVQASPSEAYPGATIVFYIDFADPSGDLNGGVAVITDSQNNPYQGFVSNAEGISGTLTTSITLSTLVTPGSLVFNIFVYDLAENPSNTISVSITVL